MFREDLFSLKRLFVYVALSHTFPRAAVAKSVVQTKLKRFMPLSTIILTKVLKSPIEI